MVPIFMGLMLFLPAGSLDYWQAWIYCGVLFIPVSFVVLYFLKKDPELLERRMRMKEKKEKQKIIQILGFLIFFSGFMISGLDYRYHWSNVPVYLVIAANAIVLSGSIDYVSVHSSCAWFLLGFDFFYSPISTACIQVIK
jgi:hypothetical protein